MYNYDLIKVYKPNNVEEDFDDHLEFLIDVTDTSFIYDEYDFESALSVEDLKLKTENIIATLEDCFSGNVWNEEIWWDITKTFRDEDCLDIKDLKNLKLTIVPSKNYKLAIKDVKIEFEIDIDEFYFENLINCCLLWFGEYEYYRMLDCNLNTLNGVIRKVLEHRQILEQKEFFKRVILEEEFSNKLIFKPKNNKKPETCEDILLETLSEDSHETYQEPLDIINMLLQSINSSIETIEDTKADCNSVDLLERFFNNLFAIVYKNGYLNSNAEGRTDNDKDYDMKLLSMLLFLMKWLRTAAAELNYDFKMIQFVMCDGIHDISDNMIVIGLKEEVIEKLASCGLVSKEPIIAEISIDNFINAFMGYNKPFDILYKNTQITITDELKIKTKTAAHNLIKKSKIIHNIFSSTKTVGNFYFEDNEIFAVIQKVYLEKDEKLDLNNDNVIYTEEILKNNKKKTIKVAYKLKPYNKKTDKTVGITLKELLAKVSLDKTTE